MGEPKFDLTFERGHDLNDVSHNILCGESAARVCPVCGSPYITFTNQDLPDFETITDQFYCETCGSEFSYTWWIGNVYVYKQGHFEDEEQE